MIFLCFFRGNDIKDRFLIFTSWETAKTDCRFCSVFFFNKKMVLSKQHLFSDVLGTWNLKLSAVFILFVYGNSFLKKWFSGPELSILIFISRKKTTRELKRKLFSFFLIERLRQWFSRKPLFKMGGAFLRGGRCPNESDTVTDLTQEKGKKELKRKRRCDLTLLFHGSEVLERPLLLLLLLLLLTLSKCWYLGTGCFFPKDFWLFDGSISFYPILV